MERHRRRPDKVSTSEKPHCGWRRWKKSGFSVVPRACANTSDTKRPIQTFITSTVRQRSGSLARARARGVVRAGVLPHPHSQLFGGNGDNIPPPRYRIRARTDVHGLLSPKFKWILRSDESRREADALFRASAGDRRSCKPARTSSIGNGRRNMDRDERRRCLFCPDQLASHQT
jgi:hypothetical protein